MRSGGLKTGELATLLSTFVALGLFVDPGRANAQTCVSSYINTLALDYEDPPASQAPNILTYDPNIEGNDYGAIYLDAITPACRSVAQAALNRKLSFTISYADCQAPCPPGTVLDYLTRVARVHPLRSWLAGAPVGLLFASAYELDVAGFPPSDSLLQHARDDFGAVAVPFDSGCGNPENSCMDDYTVSAWGFGWISAWEARKGRTASAQQFAALAQAAIGNSFRPMSLSNGSICYYEVGDLPPSCAGSPAGLLDGSVKIMGANHSQENPAYGLGLLSVVADACRGLALAGYPCAFTGGQKAIALSLLQEAQEKALPNGSSFRVDCINFANPTGPKVACSDASIGMGGYLPTDFAIKRFFDNMGIGPVFCTTPPREGAAAYQFDQYADLRTNGDRSSFFGYLRKVSWDNLAFAAWPALGTLCAALRGFNDPAACANAIGWAADANRPSTAVSVDLFNNGNYFMTVPANQLRGGLPVPGNHGWSTLFPPVLRDGNQHIIRAQFSGTNVNLGTNLQTFTCPVPSSLTVNPASVLAGGSSTGTVLFTLPAPSSGLTLLFSSSSPSATTVPSSKTVTSGTSTTFQITTSTVAGVTPVTIRASAGTVTRTATLTINPSNPDYDGYFETVNCQFVQGWAKNVNAEATPITVDIYADNILQANFLAASPREQSVGNHGFFFPLPIALKNAQTHPIEVRFGGTAVSLPPLGPTTVNCNTAEQALVIDMHSSGASTNLNGFLEPGETVQVEPSWKNTSGSSLTLSGTASSFTGPAGTSVTYTITDNAASYGSIGANATKSCFATANCYKVSVSNPAARPVTHWDATLQETFSATNYKNWAVHLGKSFSDVPTSHAFYKSIETILHHGITAGCTASTYCPNDSITRAQMAVFLLKALHGSAYVPPPAIGIFPDVPAGSFARDWVEQLYREGITGGCGGGNFCPNSPTTRAQMAVFLLLSKHGAGYQPPAATGTVFSDVPDDAFAAAFIEQLADEGGVAKGSCPGAGTTAGNYCPNDPTTRAQMAGFVAGTFAFTPYGP